MSSAAEKDPTPFITEHNADDIDFGVEDLFRLLRKCDPRTLPYAGGQPPTHIVELPNRPDILLRWVDAARRPRCFATRPEDLVRHATTHAQRQADLVDRGIVVLGHRSFWLERCPQRDSPVAYTVVKRITDALSLHTGTTDPEQLTWFGHTLLDSHQAVPVGEPRIWDNTNLAQYCQLPDGRFAMLDLDQYLTRDPRSPYPRLVDWALHITHDGRALYTRVLDEQGEAAEAYDNNVNNCREPLWP